MHTRFSHFLFILDFLLFKKIFFSSFCNRFDIFHDFVPPNCQYSDYNDDVYTGKQTNKLPEFNLFSNDNTRSSWPAHLQRSVVQNSRWPFTPSVLQPGQVSRFIEAPRSPWMWLDSDYWTKLFVVDANFDLYFQSLSQSSLFPRFYSTTVEKGKI